MGADSAYDTGQMKVGRRLAMKLLNASKLALTIGESDGDPAKVTHPLDRAMLAGLREVVVTATRGWDSFDYTRSLEVTESFFWTFCDNYIELIKDRAYGAQGEDAAASARASLRIALSVLLRLFAPFLPYATEEVWSWWQEGSVHRASWPTVAECGAAEGDGRALHVIGEALAGIRKAKSDAKLGMRAQVTSMTLTAPADVQELIRAGEDDLRAAGKVTGMAYADGPALVVQDVELLPPPPRGA